MISLRHVDCAISGRTILRDVTCEMESSCAIVGVNGVGKTTLLRTMAGLSPPSAGTIVLGKKDIHRMNPKERAKLLSFVGQEESLDADFTVEDAVSLGRLPYIKPWQHSVDVNDALEQVGIADLKHRKCAELSGGQRRLVHLARVIAQDTPVVMLDEPTNHLDVRHQLEMLAILQRMNRQVIATVHDLDLALSHFNTTVLIHEGTVLAAGRSEEVLTPENIALAFGVTAIVVRPAEARTAHLVFES